MADKYGRRTKREEALATFNELAEAVGLARVGYRATGAEVKQLFGELVDGVTEDDFPKLRGARDLWCSNGGTELPAAIRGQKPEDIGLDGGNDGGPVAGHRTLQQEFYNKKTKGGFRLQSKAFMMTFNSLAFVVSAEFWMEFLTWVKERAQRYQAKFWSCTMERSLRAHEQGRVHLHAYWSWTGERGVDHANTDQWCFHGTRPRVDVNSERRGPYEWKRACQHGHFYVQCDKVGTVFSATNYAAWEADWIPEVWWVTKLWKHHKLSHEAYLALSIKLRDGHDRRKACVEAIIAAESALSHSLEQSMAREAIAKRALPFKPLPAEIERFKMQFDEVLDRYMLLVLWGPSRTGKSKLARSLYGEAQTLVVDIQHAMHPDLRDYKRGRSLALLLDEMSSPEFIIQNKKLLQAHVDGAKLGQSATQLYSYNVFLWRLPIIITTNNWNLDDLEEVDREWIESNCLAVYIGEPVWLSRAKTAAAAPDSLVATPRSTAESSRSKRAASTLSPGVSPDAKHTGLCCPACGQRLPVQR